LKKEIAKLNKIITDRDAIAKSPKQEQARNIEREISPPLTAGNRIFLNIHISLIDHLIISATIQMQWKKFLLILMLSCFRKKLI